MTMSKTKTNAISQKIKALNEKFKADKLDLIKLELKTFFDLYPALKTIGWSQMIDGGWDENEDINIYKVVLNGLDTGDVLIAETMDEKIDTFKGFKKAYTEISKVINSLNDGFDFGDLFESRGVKNVAVTFKRNKTQLQIEKRHLTYEEIDLLADY